MWNRLLRKEILLIGHALGGLVTLFALSLSLLFLLYIGVETNEALGERSIRGLQWAILFVLNFSIISQSLFEEREAHGLEASLSEHSITSIYFAKSFGVWICTCFVNGILVFLFPLFFQNATWKFWFAEWVFLNLGAASLVLLGVSLGLVSFESRLKEILIPLLQLPYSVPVFLFGLEAENRFLRETNIDWASLGLLVFFAFFYGTLGALILELLRKEN